jgi:hypothetical protein
MTAGNPMYDILQERTAYNNAKSEIDSEALTAGMVNSRNVFEFMDYSFVKRLDASSVE